MAMQEQDRPDALSGRSVGVAFGQALRRKGPPVGRPAAEPPSLPAQPPPARRPAAGPQSHALTPPNTFAMTQSCRDAGSGGRECCFSVTTRQPQLSEFSGVARQVRSLAPKHTASRARVHCCATHGDAPLPRPRRPRRRYAKDGFQLIAFPCNQFGGQAPLSGACSGAVCHGPGSPGKSPGSG